jgi:hypothetical protein
MQQIHTPEATNRSVSGNIFRLYGTGMFITTFTRALHLMAPSANEPNSNCFVKTHINISIIFKCEFSCITAPTRATCPDDFFVLDFLP